MDGLRVRLLRLVYRLFPFNLKGDLKVPLPEVKKDISCIINFFGRTHLLEAILYSLLEQDLPEERFEVLLVEDRGGTEEGRKIAERFNNALDIRYYVLTENFGIMGYSRNTGVSAATGRYILLLDDDTVILQKDFLRTLIEEFQSSGADAIIPRGMASYYLLEGRYGYHEPYFPTSRCMAYTRETLEELRGFVSEIIGQEDVEFTIRFIASGKRYHRSEKLWYLHPPLILNNLNKPKAVGASFSGLRKRYPLLVWLMLLINGARFLPFLFFPFKKKWRIQGLFSLGFLSGVIQGISGKRPGYN